MKENNRTPDHSKYLSGRILEKDEAEVLEALEEMGDMTHWEGIPAGIWVMRLEQIRAQKAAEQQASSPQSPTAVGSGYTDEMRRNDKYRRRVYDGSTPGRQQYQQGSKGKDRGKSGR